MIKKTLKGTGLELSDAITSAVDRVISSIEKYTDPSDTSVLVDVEVAKTTNHHRSGDIFRAEINFRSRIGNLRAEAEREELHAALIAAKDEIVESLRTRKSKRMDFVRKSGLKLKNMLRGLPGFGKQAE
ncbi:MAG: HPF/RaiA family ribosome-associated protein [Candidatus Paceibacterota bacterium]|jgi:ribosomal subunit interface protein